MNEIRKIDNYSFKNKNAFSFRSPQCMSRRLKSLEAEEQRRKETRRIVLEENGGYRSDTDIDTGRHVVHFRTS